MKIFCTFKFLIAVVAAVTLTSCKDYLDNTNGEIRNGRIGLPGNVHVLNTENNNSKSRAANIIPDNHTGTFMGGGENPIYLRYTTTPGIVTNSKDNNVAAASTRATSITTSNFYDSYSLYSYVYPSDRTWAATTLMAGKKYDETYFDEEVSLASSWSTNELWPGAAEKCTFFAYAPYHVKGLSNFTTNAWPSFHYSVPTDVAEQKDLLVTRNVIPADANTYGNIDMSGGFNRPDSLTFDHACTAIRFAIGDQMAPGVITKIKFNNVYGTGDYNYETESWSNLDSLKSFTLTQSFEIKPGEHNKILTNDDNVFMMIPQKLPTDATMEVTVNDGSERTIKAYIRNDEWKKGYTVTYYLSTAKVESSYVLSIAPASGNIANTGGTKAVTIRSYKKSYYGSLVAVPWTASYTYDDADEVGTTTYNTPTAVVPVFVSSGNGSTTGESANFQVASQVVRSRSWRSTHTQTLRNAAEGGGDLASGKPTANCYIIQAPGTYTFPLVYGNALNSDGSTPNTTSFGTSTFVDHKGVQIDNPFIYLTNAGVNVPYDACIVWQDAPHLVTPSSVQLTSDKHSIQFTVERKNICQGNCVIAVRDKDQNIMWSWHIWVTDHSMTNTYQVHNNPSAGGDVICNFMEVQLGWCDADVRVYDPRTFHITVKQTDTDGQTATANVLQLSSDSTYTYGVNAPVYQWGRKDPMLPNNGMGNIDKPYYDNQYNPRTTQSSSNIKDMIMHPNMFDTASNGSLELWCKGNTTTGQNNNFIYKTIYDPSPSYFNLPKSAAFSGFVVDNTAGYTNSPSLSGYSFYTVYSRQGVIMPLYQLGCRNPSGDVVDWNGTNFAHGNWWTGIPDCNLHTTNGNANMQANTKTYGLNILPVKVE